MPQSQSTPSSLIKSKSLLIITAAIVLLAIVGLGLVFVNNNSNNSAINSASVYTEFRQEFKNTDIKVLDNYTALSYDIESLLSEKQYWQNLYNSGGGATTYPKPTISKLGGSKEEVLKKIEDEKNKMLGLKSRFDKIDCEKVKETDKSDCKKIKENFNGVEARYSSYIDSIKNF